MLHDRLVMSWERSARKQRAWSIIHLILLQSITLHLLYIIWAATCHARPSSHSPMLESDCKTSHVGTDTSEMAITEAGRSRARRTRMLRQTQIQNYLIVLCLSDASERDKCDECLPPVLSHQSHRWECFKCVECEEGAHIADSPTELLSQ